MHCVSCGYELIGLPPGACPECSHPFDPDDPATWDERPIARWRKLLTSRWSVYIAVSLTVVGAMWATILPRPNIAWDGQIDPLLWVWFDRPFGVERQTALPQMLELSWWDGTLTGVRLRRPDPSVASLEFKLAWDIRRRTDRWSLDVLQSDVPLNSVLLAYNSMRSDDELFGLQLVDPNETPDAPPRSGFDNPNTEPFRASGRQEDILAAILVAYDLNVRSLLITPDDTDLWVFDKDHGRLERITVAEADARGIEYELVEGIGVRRHRFRQ